MNPTLASEDRTAIMVTDSSRAYFCAKTDEDRPTFVELPGEHPNHGTHVGLLKQHMYGTLGAAGGSQEEYSCTLIELGFRQGRSNPCIFRHASDPTVCAVHGGDFTVTGPHRLLRGLGIAMRKKYELKVGGVVCPGPGDDKEATVLNRVIRWGKGCAEYGADPRQAEKLVYELGLEGARAVVTPGVKLTPQQIAEDEPLEKRKESLFWAAAARANYLSADRIDIPFAAKEVCRFMSSPTSSSIHAIKRLGRYLEKKKR